MSIAGVAPLSSAGAVRIFLSGEPQTLPRRDAGAPGALEFRVIAQIRCATLITLSALPEPL